MAFVKRGETLEIHLLFLAFRKVLFLRGRSPFSLTQTIHFPHVMQCKTKWSSIGKGFLVVKKPPF